MKRKIIAGLMALTMLVALVGCGKEKSASADNKESDKKFTVGFDAEFPPYGYMDDNGEYTGFDLELAEAVCKLQGWELEKKPINWDAKDMELNSGTIDCIWNGFTMNGLEDKYTWSDPYVDNSIVAVVKKDSGIKKLEDLAGKVVDVQADSSGLKALTNKEDNDKNLALTASFKQLQQVADYNTAFMNLESGAADAVIVDIGVANYRLEAAAGKFEVLSEQVSTEQYAIGFKKGNEELRDQVQESINKLVEDGTFKKLAEKYKISDMVCLE